MYLVSFRDFLNLYGHYFLSLRSFPTERSVLSPLRAFCPLNFPTSCVLRDFFPRWMILILEETFMEIKVPNRIFDKHYIYFLH